MSQYHDSGSSQGLLTVRPQETSSGGAGLAVIRGKAVEDLPLRPARPGALSARSGLAADTPPRIYQRFMLEHLAKTFGDEHLSSAGPSNAEFYSAGGQFDDFSRERKDSTADTVLGDIDARLRQPGLIHDLEIDGEVSSLNLDQLSEFEPKEKPESSQRETVDLKDVRNDLTALVTKHGCNKSFFSSCTGKFLSDVRLWRYMDQPKVRSILDQCNLEEVSDEEKDWLATKICSKPRSKTDIGFKSYRKILALLIRIQKQGQIRRFVDEELHDSLLPLKQVDGPEGFVQLVLDERCGPHPCFVDWDHEHIGDFAWKQWEMCAPFFKTENDDLRHYIFPGGIAIPLIPAGEGQVEGAGGHVAKVQLPEAHGNLRTRQTGERKQLFAVKKLKSSDRGAFEAEAHALGRLNKIRKQHEQETNENTKHISMIAATFEIECGSILHFYLVFPCADGNLREFWNMYSTARDPEHVYSLSRWMAEQIHGLASALHILHEFYVHRAEDDDDPRNHGIHGDIKPENILRFTNWDNDTGKHGVLQLADFGLTKYHHTLTVNHVDPHMRFHPYCAPEVQANWRTNQSLDTWALGCLFFEFCLWVVFGNEGLRGFDGSRTTVNSDGSVTVGMLFEIHGYGVSGWWPFPRVNKKITIHEGVVQWAKKIHGLPWVPKFIHDLVDIVLTDILVPRNDSGEHPTSPNDTRTSQSSSSPRSATSQESRPHLPMRRNTTVRSEPSRVPPPRKRFWSTDLPKKRISVSELCKKLEDMVGQDDEYFTQGFSYDMGSFKTARPFRYVRQKGKRPPLGVKV
ncbi:hypothetical protein CEP51_005815 [Fusarium floridanum]|uniref:Protein kinase domain-containing protein n=1 Tax=Fusarium floridanum TaxID=1325733 RepID=A0A428RV60_9HYPO|nr:hypothetical protein CEP51_005815 [Fusarium floridanum]